MLTSALMNLRRSTTSSCFTHAANYAMIIMNYICWSSILSISMCYVQFDSVFIYLVCDLQSSFEYTRWLFNINMCCTHELGHNVLPKARFIVHMDCIISHCICLSTFGSI